MIPIIWNSREDNVSNVYYDDKNEELEVGEMAKSGTVATETKTKFP